MQVYRFSKLTTDQLTMVGQLIERDYQDNEGQLTRTEVIKVNEGSADREGCYQC